METVQFRENDVHTSKLVFPLSSVICSRKKKTTQTHFEKNKLVNGNSFSNKETLRQQATLMPARVATEKHIKSIHIGLIELGTNFLVFWCDV